MIAVSKLSAFIALEIASLTTDESTLSPAGSLAIYNKNPFMTLVVESQQEDLMSPFIEDLLKEAKIDTMPDDFKNEYRRRLAGQLMERLGLVAMRALSDSDLPRAEELASQEKFDELMQFLKKNIPNFAEVMDAALKDFRTSFIASLAL